MKAGLQSTTECIFHKQIQKAAEELRDIPVKRVKVVLCIITMI